MRPEPAPAVLSADVPVRVRCLVLRMRRSSSSRAWLGRQSYATLLRIASALGVTYHADPGVLVDAILFAKWQRTGQ